jgi:hypothetical protein
LTDLYGVGGPLSSNYLLRNRGDGTFEERAAAAGAQLTGTFGSGPVAADIDADGDLDLFVGGINGTPIAVLRNAGNGTFTDVTSSAGLAVNHNVYGGAFGDYDGDGDLDFYMASWVRLVTTETPPVAKRRQRNVHRRDRRGERVGFTRRFGAGLELHTQFQRHRQRRFGRSARRGRLRHQSGLSQRQRRHVRARHRRCGDHRRERYGSVAADFDNDGDVDWFVTSILDPDGTAEGHWGVTGNRLYRNTGDGTFEDVTEDAGVRDGGWGWASCAADFNLDGWLDILHVNGFESDSAQNFYFDTTRLFVARGDGRFEERAFELGLSDNGQGRGVVCFDYDRDGDVDVFVANNDEPVRLWRNGAETLGSSYLEVSVTDPGANTHGIGARVYATAGGVTQMREIRAGSNFESQDPAVAHFGFGNASTIDELRVVWPDDASVTETALAPNQVLTIPHP